MSLENISLFIMFLNYQCNLIFFKTTNCLSDKVIIIIVVLLIVVLLGAVAFFVIKKRREESEETEYTAGEAQPKDDVDESAP